MSWNFAALRAAPAGTSRARRCAITTAAKGFWLCSRAAQSCPASRTRTTGKGHATPPAPPPIGMRVPHRDVASEHQQAYPPHAVPIKNAVIVDIHALAQVRVGVALNFDVNEQPGFRAIAQEDFDEPVRIAAPQG